MLRVAPFAVAVSTVVVSACRPPATASRGPALACRADRVSRVAIAGGTVDDVPQLAILEGTLDDPARTERVRLAAIDALRAKGYPRAYVGVVRRAGCGVELDVSVVSGPRFRIATLDIVADDDFPAAARLAAIEDGVGTINTVGGAYVEDRLVQALAELERRYRAAGWVDADIEPPRAVLDEERGTVRVTIVIHAGERT